MYKICTSKINVQNIYLYKIAYSIASGTNWRHMNILAHTSDHNTIQNIHYIILIEDSLFDFKYTFYCMRCSVKEKKNHEIYQPSNQLFSVQQHRGFL